MPDFFWTQPICFEGPSERALELEAALKKLGRDIEPVNPNAFLFLMALCRQLKQGTNG